MEVLQWLASSVPWPDVLKIGLPLLGGFFVGRLSKHLDRRGDEKRKAAKWQVTAGRDRTRHLENVGDAEAFEVKLEGSLVLRGFAPTDLKPGEHETFSVQRPTGKVTVVWKDAEGRERREDRQVPGTGRRKVKVIV